MTELWVRGVTWGVGLPATERVAVVTAPVLFIINIEIGVKDQAMGKCSSVWTPHTPGLLVSEDILR